MIWDMPHTPCTHSRYRTWSQTHPLIHRQVFGGTRGLGALTVRRSKANSLRSSHLAGPVEVVEVDTVTY
jgi:hypothetical protein